MKADRAVILVGHGGVPTDCPASLVSDFKREEATAGDRQTAALVAADRKLRAWPRTAETDPYQVGLTAIAARLRQTLPDHVVYEAYNEFCAPSLEEALDLSVRNGAKTVTIISTMYTRGGIHSETEIPELLKRERAKHPGVDIRYAWPFDVPAIAAFLAQHVRKTEAER
jgi:sirohydrochlorin cobaltochelatase